MTAGQVKRQDPVVEACRMINELEERRQFLDNKRIALKWAKVHNEQISQELIYFEMEASDCQDRIERAEDYISTIRPTSIEGAMIQLALAHNQSVRMAEAEFPASVRDEIERTRKRLYFSAMRFLLDHAGTTVVDLQIGKFHGLHQDPWLRHEYTVQMLAYDREEEDRQKGEIRKSYEEAVAPKKKTKAA